MNIQPTTGASKPSASHPTGQQKLNVTAKQNKENIRARSQSEESTTLTQHPKLRNYPFTSFNALNTFGGLMACQDMGTYITSFLSIEAIVQLAQTNQAFYKHSSQWIMKTIARYSLQSNNSPKRVMQLLDFIRLLDKMVCSSQAFHPITSHRKLLHYLFKTYLHVQSLRRNKTSIAYNKNLERFDHQLFHDIYHSNTYQQVESLEKSIKGLCHSIAQHSHHHAILHDLVENKHMLFYSCDKEKLYTRMVNNRHTPSKILMSIAQYYCDRTVFTIEYTTKWDVKKQCGWLLDKENFALIVKLLAHPRLTIKISTLLQNTLSNAYDKTQHLAWCHAYLLKPLIRKAKKTTAHLNKQRSNKPHPAHRSQKPVVFDTNIQQSNSHTSRLTQPFIQPENKNHSTPNITLAKSIGEACQNDTNHTVEQKILETTTNCPSRLQACFNASARQTRQQLKKRKALLEAFQYYKQLNKKLALNPMDKQRKIKYAIWKNIIDGIQQQSCYTIDKQSAKPLAWHRGNVAWRTIKNILSYIFFFLPYFQPHSYCLLKTLTQVGLVHR